MTAGRTMNSLSVDWGTPRKYVDPIRGFYGGHIALDPCSNIHSIVDAEVEWMLPHDDGLLKEWNFPTIFVNPPYGNDKERGTRISDWLRKCFVANQKFRAEVIALIPVAVNTGHWKKFVWPVSSRICFLYDTRLKFLENGEEGGKGSPMACSLVYWGERGACFADCFSRFGAVVDVSTVQTPPDTALLSSVFANGS